MTDVILKEITTPSSHSTTCISSKPLLGQDTVSRHFYTVQSGFILTLLIASNFDHF